MTERKIWVGTVGPMLYDDTDLIDDVDGDLSGEAFGGISTTGQLLVDQAPSQPLHVLRNGDVLSGAFTAYAETSFNVTYTGFTVTPSPVWRCITFGNLVNIQLGGIFAVSNATTFTVTGLPSGLYPARTVYCLVPVSDNSVGNIGALIFTTTTVTVALLTSTGFQTGAWTASGSKGITACDIVYTKL